VIENYRDFYILTLDDTALSEKEQELVRNAGTEDDIDEINELLQSAQKIANPKALYGVVPVTVSGTERVCVGGVEITCALMHENFKTLSRVFPYIASCGTELENWSAAYAGDPLAAYWADAVKKLYLNRVMTALRTHIREYYGISDYLTSMNPGSIKEWPLPAQRDLFTVLGGDAQVKDAIGVTLTDSFLMLPSKSCSGISFSSKSEYENCALCPLIRCPNRRAPYQNA